MSYSIAIDGPSGAGKSVLAKGLAKELGFKYVDTGAIYRSVGYYMYEHGVDVTDEKAVEKALEGVEIKLDYSTGIQRVLVNGIDYGDKIRLPEISMYASAVGKIPAVREKLLDVQRDAAKHNDTVMDGRDIGTVVLPNADVKIFLSASLDDRAYRRWRELKQKGVNTTLEEVRADMHRRDLQDSTRALAPCVPAEDAVLLDNTGMEPDETLALALEIVRSKLGEPIK
ncbi:MAG TPA: (d)CMP kinase [Bacillota bacterium]|nr:(d)CMP kinase [Clostridiales bacterium]HPT84676.1 (d)CMP kinase [Bacillota bacterium]